MGEGATNGVEVVSERGTTIKRYHFVGDVHGNAEQLRMLLLELGYGRPEPESDPHLWVPPAGAQLVSVGDIVDRGPDSLTCLRIFSRMVAAGHARMVLGNHELRTLQMLRAQLGEGPAPFLALGRRMTWVGLLGIYAAEKRQLLAFLEGLPLFLLLDDERVIVVHARWEPELRSADPDVQRASFARGKPEPKGVEPTPDSNHPLPLDTLSPADPLPARARWVRSYRGRSLVIWGHETVRRGAVIRLGNTVNVESGCLNGHPLSVWIYPDDEVVQATGSQAWRTVAKRYMPALEIAFPEDLKIADRLRSEYGADDEDLYIESLKAELASRGAPAPYPELEATHRRLFRRL